MSKICIYLRLNGAVEVCGVHKNSPVRPSKVAPVGKPEAIRGKDEPSPSIAEYSTLIRWPTLALISRGPRITGWPPPKNYYVSNTECSFRLPLEKNESYLISIIFLIIAAYSVDYYCFINRKQ